MRQCPDCQTELPDVGFEGELHTCQCGRRFASYCVDFSSPMPSYRWNPLPKGDGYTVHSSGIPIVKGEE